MAANARARVALSFPANLAIALAVLLLGGAGVLLYHDAGDPSLHAVLDTSGALIAALIALLLWDTSRRTDQSWPLWLAISFTMLAVGELLHVASVLGWLGGGSGSDMRLRAATWGPSAYLLPIGVGASLLLRARPRRVAWPFAAALTLLAIALFAIFLSIPRHTGPGLLWVTRPSLILVPLLWALIAATYWRRRDESEIARAIALTAVLLAGAHVTMVYSHASNDTPAMVAHFGKFVGEALLLFNLIQIGAADTARRRQVERQLTELNRDLDARVAERTEALLASEQRNRLIVESALDAVVTIDSAGVVTGWTPQSETMFGWTRDEAIGRPIAETILPERYREAHLDGLARYLATGEARVLNRRIELAALHRDGSEFPIELSITSVRMGDAVSFTAFIRDVTDRKLAETRLQTQRDRLHLLEQITRAIGQRQDMHSIFQVAVRTLEDRLPADFACICLYDRVAHALTVAHVGVGSAPLGEELGITDRAKISIDKNGLSRCVAGTLVYEPDIAAIDFPFPSRLARQGLRSLVMTPLLVEGETFGVLVVSRLQDQAFLSTDCEFLKQLGEHVGLAAHQAQLLDRLQQAYDDLRQTQQAVLEQERLRAVGQMASGIAHDINNAISPVAIYTQSLLERELDLAPELQDYLEIVGRVVKDISATVARMRDFYRAEDDEAELAPLNLNELVPQVVELTRARWSDMPQQRGIVITVSTELEADLPLVMGNVSELREAATNLIFNAVDAMPEGGTITIRTETLRAESRGRPRVRLEVGDTGRGMDTETRRRCLQPFFTTKGERGTGLGLAMVQGAAQRHKAQLDIDSAPGKGTRIRLAFAAATKAQTPAQAARASSAVRPLRLLLVDDDPAVLGSTTIVLKRKGHAITAADGGQAGIDALREAHMAGETFDAVITDLGMPYIDGNQVALAVKEIFPATPVVMLTGWGRRMGSGGEAQAHIDFILAKPLDLDELSDVFARLG